MKFRKKPVTIEAEKISDLMSWAQSNWKKLPEWVKDNYESGKIVFADTYISIKTLEGTMRGEKDDMLIQGINGECYPCKPDIFEKTYDKEYDTDAISFNILYSIAENKNQTGGLTWGHIISKTIEVAPKQNLKIDQIAQIMVETTEGDGMSFIRGSKYKSGGQHYNITSKNEK